MSKPYAIAETKGKKNINKETKKQTHIMQGHIKNRAWPGSHFSCAMHWLQNRAHAETLCARARAIFQRLLYQNLCRSDQYILYDSDDSEPMWKLGLTSEFLEGGRPPWYFKTPDLENSKLREAAWIAWQI